MKETTHTIKVMADYFCFPLWQYTEDGGLNLDPKLLPIPESLVIELYQWAESFGAILDLDDPIRSGFTSEADKLAFNIKGQTLANQLQQLLGEHYLITFQGSKVLDHP